MKRFSLIPLVKRLLAWGILAIFLGLGLTILAHKWVQQSAAGLVFEEVDAVPSNDVALLLGTNRLINGQYLNPYFQARIEAVVQLYEAQKIKHILISGDHSRQTYNEPQDMKEALRDRGIPARAITLDYAGFRTLDSVVRAKEVFQQSHFTLVSQEFHNERALFIAKHKGLQAVGYNAKLPATHRYSKVKWREYLARTKAILDVFVLGKQPKFLGAPIAIQI